MGRLSQGQVIAAVGGIALLVAMFLPWIGMQRPVAPAGSPEGVDTSTLGEHLEGLDARHLPPDHRQSSRSCPL